MRFSRIITAFHNNPIGKRIIKVVTLCIILSSIIIGFFYYDYTSKTILKTYSQTMEREKIFIEEDLEAKNKMMFSSQFSLVTNNEVRAAICNYSRFPSNINKVALDSLLHAYLNNFKNMNDGYIQSYSVVIDSSFFYDYTETLKNNNTVNNFTLPFNDTSFENQYYKVYPVMDNPFFKNRSRTYPVVSTYEINGVTIQIIALISEEYLLSYFNKYTTLDQVNIFDHRNIPQSVKNINTKEIIENVTLYTETEQKNMPISQKFNAIPYLIESGTIQSLGWKIQIMKSTLALNKDLNSLLFFIVFVIGIISFICIFIISALSQSITKPLRDLVNVMKIPLSQRLRTNFVYPYHDEIGTLSARYNEMMEEIDDLVLQLNDKIEDLKEEREQLSWEQQQTKLAEIKALEAQINPHFLYNSLNSISWLAVKEGAPDAAQLATTLGRFYRIGLNKGKEFISLHEEKEHLISYLEIQKTRYKEILTYTISFPPELSSYLIPKFILQPLVENALYHGLKAKGAPGLITIKAEEDNDTIICTVSDDGKGIEKEKLARLNQNLHDGIIDNTAGYGIFNVNLRLQLTYGPTYSLRLESEENKGCRSIITIKKKKEKE